MTSPATAMTLAEAFDVQPGDIISLIGAGGKTSLMWALAGELRAAGWRVIVTTTTKIAADQTGLFPALVELDGTVAATADTITAALDAHGCVCVIDRFDPDAGKALGILPDEVAALRDLCRPDVLLIEADGARGLPLKYPKQGEPVLAAATTRAILCAGLSALHQPPSTQIYNYAEAAERFLTLDSMRAIYMEMVILLNLYQQMLVQRQRRGLRTSLFFNQAGAAGRSLGTTISGLGHSASDRVVYGDAQYRTGETGVVSVKHRVAAVVLAAGLATRMGEMKVLLPWGDAGTILDHVLKICSQGGVHDRYVVTGNEAEAVEAVAERAGTVTVVHNPDFAQGDMLSSVKAGLRALPKAVQAALIVLGDQPMIEANTVRRVIAAYDATRPLIVAPSFDRRRGHPILIDRRLWPELLALPADGAPRDVINRYADAIVYVNVDNDSILRDVDTPEQYADELRRAGLAPDTPA